MKKQIYIKLDGVLIDTREVFYPLLEREQEKIISGTSFDYRKQFNNDEEYQSFFDLHGQEMFNNNMIYREQLNELISIANESLYPVIIYQEKLYQKQAFHITNLLAKQKNLIISGMIVMNDIQLNKKNIYIYDDELKMDKHFDLYDNSLCDFFKNIEQDIKAELSKKK